MNTIVYSTSTEVAHRKASTARGIAAVAAAPVTAKRPATTGWCTSCGSVEVALAEVTGSRDLTAFGESATYPTGFGCEVCS
jgi:hypothetical protein